MTAPPTLLAAALDDRYRIERELGAGGMATVYLAHDLKHDRKVAIKVLRPELSAALGEERFLREITTTAGLRHPHILPLYDSGAAAGSLFYVMPHVDGETIESWLRREKQLPLLDALRIAREVADALSYAHEHGIVHRDIKPANIMFESGHAVVTDFGIARAVQAAGGTQLTQVGFSIGTPSYMSPEQAAGEQRIDGRSDLYSLGCVLYEMLTGNPPYTGTTAAAVVSQHLTAAIPTASAVRSGIPAAVDAIVTRLLAKDPAERFARATELVAALDRSMTPSGTPTAERPAVRSAGSRRGLIFAGIGLAVLILAAGWLLSRRGTSAPPALTFRQLTFSAEVEEFPALSADGSRLVFSRDVGGIRQLFLLDVATGTESRITRDSSDNIRASWYPDGKSIVFVRARQPRVRMEPGDKFGTYVGGDIWRRDIESGVEERLIEDAYDPSVAPDGRLAFDATRGATRRIWIADGAGRNAQQVSQDSSEAVSHLVPRWSPDGKQIVFQTIERTRFDVRIIDLETRTSHAMTSDGYADVEPAWDPSGRAIWYTSNRAGGYNVWRLAILPDGGPDGLPVQMTTGAGEDVQVAVAERGGRLAFTVLHLNADLWRLPVDPGTGRPTGAPEPVVVTTREDSRGAWSPDGSRIVFNSDRGGNMNLYVRTLADGSDRQLTNGAGGDYQPRWSPDGKRVVFFSARSGNNDIWSVDLASGTLTQLTNSPSLDINPSFSPDGSTIGYHSDQGGRLDLWLMNADGTNPRRLSRGGVAVAHFLLWSHDGKYLYLRDGTTSATPVRIAVADGSMDTVSFRGGSHMSLNPAGTVISDVIRHRWLWASQLGGAADSTFAFDDPAVRLDYPVWSPDGRWILFDRSKPEGGDIWLMERSK